MNKKIATLCAIAIVGILFMLTLLGRKVEPHVSILRAFIVPFGASAWEYAMSSQVEDGMSRKEIESNLGPATNTYKSMTRQGSYALEFQNPHDEDRAIIVSFDSDDRAKSISPISMAVSANGRNIREVLEDLGTKTTDTASGYQIAK